MSRSEGVYRELFIVELSIRVLKTTTTAHTAILLRAGVDDVNAM